MNEEQFYNMRETQLYCLLSTKELKAIHKEIDDARTEKDDPRVLEVACGSGEAMKRMIKEFNITKIKGIDICETSVKMCKDKGLDVVQGDVQNLPFEDDEFDFVYAQFILEHVDDAVKAINECLRVARRAIFVVAMGERPDADKTGEHEIENLHVKRIITEDVLKEILKKVPYERHRIEKNVVVYNCDGRELRNYIVVIDRINRVKKKEEVE